MTETPIRDVALCIELGERPIRALMTQADWNRRLHQELAHWAPQSDKMKR